MKKARRFVSKWERQMSFSREFLINMRTEHGTSAQKFIQNSCCSRLGTSGYRMHFLFDERHSNDPLCSCALRIDKKCVLFRENSSYTVPFYMWNFWKIPRLLTRTTCKPLTYLVDFCSLRICIKGIENGTSRRRVTFLHQKILKWSR